MRQKNTKKNTLKWVAQNESIPITILE